MKIALGLRYCGSAYYGWQRQRSGVPSVQATVEDAIAMVANHEVQLICAGRTDAGVHAFSQVVHFESASDRSMRAWVLGSNAALPADVSVQWACAVDETFHARFSARLRRYHYVIYNADTRPGLFNQYVTWRPHHLDDTQMHIAAQILVGRHDFSAFRAAQCQAKSPVRSVHSLHVYRLGHYVIIDVIANAFLQHMVRNISGALLAIGEGKQDKAWLARVLQSKDRRQAAITAPANGLYFVEVTYPSVYNLPQPDGQSITLPPAFLTQSGVMSL